MATDLRVYLFALAPTLVVVAVAPGLAALVADPPLSAAAIGPVRYAGVPVVVVGLGLALWAVDAFARAGVPPSPADTPDRLVTDGPLAYTRNPIYLGTALAAAGMALLLVSVVVGLYAVVLWVAYHLFAVYHEEPRLREELGEPYERYCEEVPRWI